MNKFILALLAGTFLCSNAMADCNGFYLGGRGGVVKHDYSKNIFQREFIVGETFHKIARKKVDVIEFRKIENVRFQKHGRGNIERSANLGKIREKLRVHHFALALVYKLFADFAALDRFCPDTHPMPAFRFSRFFCFLSSILYYARGRFVNSFQGVDYGSFCGVFSSARRAGDSQSKQRRFRFIFLRFPRLPSPHFPRVRFPRRLFRGQGREFPRFFREFPLCRYSFPRPWR